MTSHCDPSTDPLAVQVPSVDDGNVWVVEPSSGLRRGIFVWLHGGPQGPIPVPVPLTDWSLTFANTLVADGWVNVSVTFPEDFVAVPGMGAVFDDVVADTGNGARFVDSSLKWWDHVVTYLQRRWGPWPIVLMGGSWGGWHTLQIMRGRPDGIAGFICSIAAVKFSGIADNIASKTWSTLDSSGADFPTSGLNAITVPGIIQTMTYLGGTYDPVVTVADQIAVKNAAIAAGRAITYIADDGAGHPGTHLTAPPTSLYTTWVTGTLDPTCPAAF